jgi:Protein of unknown function (DUF3750)
MGIWPCGLVRRFFKLLGWSVIVLMVMPSAVGTVMGYARGWPSSWRAANWNSSGLLPEASQVEPAKVIILASRTGNWKSIFAEHMSIVVKPKGAGQWTRYDVVGWGNPVRRDAYAADAFWYGNTPKVIFELSGAEAAQLVPAIEASISRYPYQSKGSYVIWPGPNSNTFVSWVVRNTKGFKAELSPVGVGKDYLGPGLQMARAPSDTGYTISVSGYVGATLAWAEGFEIHLIGSTIGIDPDDLAIKLPALGKLSYFDSVIN